MGFLDKLFGRNEPEQQPQWGQQGGQYGQPQYGQPQGGNQYGTRQGYNPAAGQRTQRFGSQQQTTDEQALERYRYMLRTAPPETLEQAHAEAFSQLTPEQRQMVLQQLSQTLPENERNSSAYQSDDPQTLARMATRAEMRQPGTLERTWGGMGGNRGGMGMGMGGLMAGSFLSTIAGVMVGSMIANAFFDSSGFNDAGADGGAGDAGADAGGADAGADAGAGDYGGDAGGFDSGGSFGDFGGGDFGGGDFGGDF